MFHKNLRATDLHSPSQELVENNSGSTITALSCVNFNGQGTNYPNITLASGSNSNLIRGVVQSTIPDGGIGYICCFGFVNLIDTSAWTVGTLLYSDTSGQLSSTVLGSSVAQVLKQDAALGVIYISRSGPTGSTGPAGPSGPGLRVDTITLNSGQIAAKAVTLSNTPSNPMDVAVTIVGGCPQNPTVDFSVSGNQVSWTGLGMDTILSMSDTLIIEY